MHHNLQLEQFLSAAGDRPPLPIGHHHRMATAVHVDRFLWLPDAVQDAGLDAMEQHGLVRMGTLPGGQRDLDGQIGGAESGQPDQQAAFAGCGWRRGGEVVLSGRWTELVESQASGHHHDGKIVLVASVTQIPMWGGDDDDDNDDFFFKR